MLKHKLGILNLINLTIESLLKLGTVIKHLALSIGLNHVNFM